MRNLKETPQPSRRVFFLALSASLMSMRAFRVALAQDGGILEGVTAAAIAQQALSFAAGQIAENAFGQPKITDVRTWITEAVAEIEKYLAGVIAQTEIDQMIAEADGFGQNLSEYALLAPQHRAQNVYLIQDADLHTTKLLDLSIKYDQTFTVFLTAMSYRLIARQALFNLDNDKAHIISIKDQVDNFFNSAIAVFKKIQFRLAPGERIGACCIHEYIAPWWSCRPAVDANVIEGDDYIRSNYQEMEAANPVTTIAHNKFYTSFNQVFQKFQTDSITAMSSIAQAYASMSGSVGATYAPPVPIPSALPDISPNPSPRVWLTQNWKNCH
jgi:hypothetical protein